MTTSAEARLESEHQVDIARNRAEQIKAEREIETQLDWFRQRAAKQEEERLAQEAEQSERQAKAAAQRERERWRNRWIAWGIDRRPWNVPKQAEIAIRDAISMLLETLNPGDPEDVTRRLVESAADKSLQPWLEALVTQKILQEALASGCFGFLYDLRDRARLAAVEALGKIRDGATYQEKLAIATAAVQAVKKEWQHGQTIQGVSEAAVATLRDANGDERAEAEELLQTALAGTSQGTSRHVLERAAAQTLVPIRAAIEKRLAQERTAKARKEDQEIREAVLKGVAWRTLGLPDAAKQRAADEVRKALAKFPEGTSTSRLEEVRDAIAKRHQRAHELIKATLNIRPELKRMQRAGWEFDASIEEIERDIEPDIRAALEEEIRGDESPEEVARIMRQLVRQELEIIE